MVHNLFFKLDSIDPQNIRIVDKKQSIQTEFEDFLKLETKILLTKYRFNKELKSMYRSLMKKYKIMIGIEIFLQYKLITENIHYCAFEFEEHTKNHPKTRLHKKRILFSDLEDYVEKVYDKHTHFSFSFRSNQFAKNDYQSYMRQLEFDSIIDMFIILLKNKNLTFVNINIYWWYFPAMVDLILSLNAYCNVYLNSMNLSTSCFRHSHNIFFYNIHDHDELLNLLLKIKSRNIILNETFLKKPKLFQSNLIIIKRYFINYTHKKETFYKSFVKSVTSENLSRIQKQWYRININEMAKFKLL